MDNRECEQETEYQRWLAQIADPAFDVQTWRDKAVFYSCTQSELTSEQRNTAMHGNRFLAMVHARIDNGQTLEMTPGGSRLTHAKLYEKFEIEQAEKIWEAASEKFARAAYGSVRCFAHEADKARIFRQVEFPALLANEHVTTINGIERENLKRTYDLEGERAAFREIEHGMMLLEQQRVERAKQHEMERDDRAQKTHEREKDAWKRER